ncbi:hypothetical protein K1X84_06205 [bacterium]|nr:hypothetical protein [bacterium]
MKSWPNRNFLEIIFMLIITGSSLYAQHEHKDSKKANNEAFESIKGLTGKWKGAVKWTGANPRDGGIFDVEYYLTGNGTSIVENLISDGTITMTSVYHMDGSDLRMTHFCGANNHPRLKADPFNKNEKSVDFQFIDITNLSSPEAGHVHHVKLTFNDADHAVLVFTFIRSGAESYENITMTRVKGS